jgi:hypothetical protein
MQSREWDPGNRPFRRAIQKGHVTGRTVAFIGAGLLSFNGSPTNVQAQSRLSVSSPATGVICDQQGPTCYDREGPSVSLTQFYFGETSAYKLESILRGKPPSNYLLLSNGTMCDLRARSCWSDGWRKRQVDSMLSQRFFASTQAPNRTYGKGLQGLQTPREGVVCDLVSRTCYDQNGMSLAVTRDYFGAYAERSARRNLERQAKQEEFRMSNGTYCDVRARTCWSDLGSRRQVNEELTSYLFNQGSISTGEWGEYSSSTRQIRQAQCVITRWFRTLFRGDCELREQTTNLGRLLKVNLQDGSHYSIRRPNTGNYELIDPEGKTWPLQVREQGRTVDFSWSDRVLSVSDTSSSNNGINLLELINILLGR